MNRFLLPVVFLLAIGPAALAADNDSHSVTITTNSVVDLSLSTDHTITVNSSSTTWSNPGSLDYSSNDGPKRISAASDIAPDQPVEVIVSGTVGCDGTPQGAQTISTTPVDVFTAIPAGTGSCPLQYQLTPDMSVAPGTQVITVTYTMTD